MHLRMYLEYIIVFHQSKMCWNNKNLRTLTVILVFRFYFVLYEVQIFLEWTKKKQWKRIHEASKKCTNITKMERRRYIFIKSSALFFPKTAMLCIFSAFFRRFISVWKSQEILSRNGVNVLLNNAILIHCTHFCRLSSLKLNACSLQLHSLLNSFALFI